MKIEEVFGCIPTYPNQDLYGLELEIEDQQKVQENGLSLKGWSVVADGSLRNFGLEFITTPPVKLAEIEGSLSSLFKKIKISELSYSDRTSIHVHCNMQGETVDTLKSFCLLYLVTEQVFFNFVDRERFENVFCVPLMDFAAPFSLFTVLNKGKLARNWTKYSALNLLPLQQLGTVEFRHMHGTNDIQRIVTWVKAIDCLKQASKKKTFEEWRAQITSLNTTSEYGTFLVEVFGEIERDFLGVQSFDAYHSLLYSNIMRAKLWEFAELQDKARPTVAKPIRYGDTEAIERMLEARRRGETVMGTWATVTNTLAEARVNTRNALPPTEAAPGARTRNRVVITPNVAENMYVTLHDDILDDQF